MSLTHLSDDALLSGLDGICRETHHLLARLLAHLVEVEQRSLHLKAACSSLFEFCVRRLGMSESAAFRRITAARLVRRFPSLLERIERGEIHLSALVLLRDHLTEANLDELVCAASGKSKREVEELLARRAPRPDVPTMLRKLPTLPAKSTSAPAVPSSLPLEKVIAPARVEPLSESRYKLQLTASAELRDKLLRATALLRHRNPSGDLAVVMEQALDALLAKLEKERLGKTNRPQRIPRGAAKRRPKPGCIARAVRREVFERDGEQCTFLDDKGRRCEERGFLEIDHVESRALGGADDASNLRVRCRAHNRLHAEEVFGKEHVEHRIHVRQRTLRSTPLAPAVLDLATRSLVNMGFAKSAVRDALDIVSRRHATYEGAMPVPDLLREAIAALT